MRERWWALAAVLIWALILVMVAAMMGWLR
jgi:hypothetical protein